MLIRYNRTQGMVAQKFWLVENFWSPHNHCLFCTIAGSEKYLTLRPDFYLNGLGDGFYVLFHLLLGLGLDHHPGQRFGA